MARVQGQRFTGGALVAHDDHFVSKQEVRGESAVTSVMGKEGGGGRLHCFSWLVNNRQKVCVMQSLSRD